MKRDYLKIGLLAAMLISACDAGTATPESVASPTKTLPSFEFRTMKVGVTTLASASEAGIVTNCREGLLKGQERCDSVKLGFGAVGGGWITVGFEKGIFHSLFVNFRRPDFAAWVEQAHEVYGEPCDTSASDAQNAFGAQFTLQSVTWCFAEGQLNIANHMSEDISEGVLSFFPPQPVGPGPASDSAAL